jgi:lipid-binding SYLF domain-containing protein
MKKSLLSILLIAAAATLLPFAQASESKVPEKLMHATKEISKDKERFSTQECLAGFAESKQLEWFFQNSYGCAVFPTVGKGGFGLGGAHGKGWVFAKNDLTGTVRMTQVTVGFQLGGQAFSQIIFFEDERAYKTFTNDNFEFGAQASAVVITVGANAEASTAGGAGAGAQNAQAKKSYTDGMAVFMKVKGGLMYEASVGGQKFRFRPVKN